MYNSRSLLLFLFYVVFSWVSVLVSCSWTKKFIVNSFFGFIVFFTIKNRISWKCWFFLVDSFIYKVCVCVLFVGFVGYLNRLKGLNQCWTKKYPFFSKFFHLWYFNLTWVEICFELKYFNMQMGKHNHKKIILHQ